MPPSSRKRNKGKERKAKQLAKKEENERVVAHGFWLGLCRSMECKHGCAMIPPDYHPVSSFMDQFFVNSKHKRMTASQNLNEIFTTHIQIWNNESHKKIVLDILIRIGTNMLLREECDMIWPIFIVQSILALENHDGTGNIESVFNKRLVASKSRDLTVTSSSRRDALKFYRKRTSCSCLKKMHLEARKTITKMGFCWGCGKEFDRVVLFVCSRCMVGQYCSRECQVADWTNHKKSCDDYARVHKLTEV